ncbi:hypothetical protein AB5N19_11931 [Seiridium cardinale]
MDVVRKADANLQPGGWIEYQDLMLNIDSDDSTRDDIALDEFVHLVIAGATAKGRDIEISRKYKDCLAEAGFVDIVEVKFKIFGNDWSETEPERTPDEYNIISDAEVTRTISDKLLG